MKTSPCSFSFALLFASVVLPAGHADDNVGIYFGSFGDLPGEWAMSVHVGGWFDFIGFLPSKGVIVESYPYVTEIYSDGSFDDYDFIYTLAGNITNGSVSGTFATSTTDTIRGDRDESTGGPGWPVQGMISLRGTPEFPNNRGPTENAGLIVGPGGRFVITAWVYSSDSGTYNTDWPRAWQAGASGQLDANGHATFDSPNGFHGELLIDATGNVRATVTEPGFVSDLALTGTRPTVRLINLSTRGSVGTGENNLISGFVIAGNGTKRVLIRAIGPSLDQFSITDPVPDPQIKLVRASDKAVVASADNWGEAGNASELLDAMSHSGAFAIPSGSKDAVLLADLPAGAYTAVVSDTAGRNGTGLTEIYAVDDLQSPHARLVNISTRGWVGSGQNLMIPGLVATGNDYPYLLVRAVGPTLADYGIAHPLDDPVITIYAQGNSTPVATNDDWGSDGYPSITADRFEAIGAFPLQAGSRDAAVFFKPLPNQAYTAVISGKNGATGVALAEVYEVDALP